MFDAVDEAVDLLDANQLAEGSRRCVQGAAEPSC